MRIAVTMLLSKAAARGAAIALAIAMCGAGCSSKSGQGETGTAGSGPTGSTGLGIPHGAEFRTPGPHAPPEVTIADYAYNRLGGSSASATIQVKSVSVVGNYGLAVIQIGANSNETLFEKENGVWRALASDAYVPGGRGLLRFGVSPYLARRLDAELHPVPQQ